MKDRLGDVIALSFGLCEPFALDRVLVIELFDAFYAIANAQGQTVVVAAGDGGATECGDGQLAVNALASSPHAIAVGGTSFDLLPDGSLPPAIEERVWADGFGGGGGGESVVFARPRHQIALAIAGTRGGRLLPDLALTAGPDSPGYVIYEDGRPQVIGGTSAGAIPRRVSAAAVAGPIAATGTRARSCGASSPDCTSRSRATSPPSSASSRAPRR